MADSLLKGNVIYNEGLSVLEYGVHCKQYINFITDIKCESIIYYEEVDNITMKLEKLIKNSNVDGID